MVKRESKYNIDIELAKQLYSKGVPVIDIAKKFGCSRQLLNTHLRNAGIKFDRRLGRIITWNGYVSILKKDHPHAVRGHVREHRLVMEEYLGRYLRPEEEVHHKDHNKLNNKIENLELFSTKSEHLRHEHKEGLYVNHLRELHGL